MRILQSILSEAFHEDQALRMYPPEKVKSRLLLSPAYTNGDQRMVCDNLPGTVVQYHNRGNDSNRILNTDALMLWKIVYKIVSDIDPTPQKKYAPWVMRTWMSFAPVGTQGYGSTGFGFEDSGRMTMALDFLEKHKRDGALIRSAKAMRVADWSHRGGVIPETLGAFIESGFDINKIKNLIQLESVVSDFQKFIDSDPAVQLSRRKAADAESQAFFDKGTATLCLNTETTKIVQVKSKEASCHFGVNTRWCTAATKGNNMFHRYADYGDIYIILDKPRNKRWQIFFPYSDQRGFGGYDDDDNEAGSPGFQFMNEDDNPASYNDLPDDAFKWLKPHLLMALHGERPDYVKLMQETLNFHNKYLYTLIEWDAFGRLQSKDVSHPGRIISQKPGTFRYVYETMTPEIEAFIKKNWPVGYEKFIEAVEWVRLVKPDQFNKAFASIWMFNASFGTGDPRNGKHWDKTKPVELPFFFNRGEYREVNGIEGLGMPSHHATGRSDVGDAQVYGIFLDTPYKYHTFDHKQRQRVADDETKTVWSMTGTSFSNAYWAIPSKYNMAYTSTFYQIDDTGNIQQVKALPSK